MVDSERVSHPGLENAENNKKQKSLSEELRDTDGLKDETEHHEGNPKRKPVG